MHVLFPHLLSVHQTVAEVGDRRHQQIRSFRLPRKRKVRCGTRPIQTPLLQGRSCEKFFKISCTVAFHERQQNHQKYFHNNEI